MYGTHKLFICQDGVRVCVCVCVSVCVTHSICVRMCVYTQISTIYTHNLIWGLITRRVSLWSHCVCITCLTLFVSLITYMNVQQHIHNHKILTKRIVQNIKRSLHIRTFTIKVWKTKSLKLAKWAETIGFFFAVCINCTSHELAVSFLWWDQCSLYRELLLYY